MLLAEHVPESAPDVCRLTWAFVVARYSQGSLDEQEPNVIRRVGRRIRAVLARKRIGSRAREESGELAG